MIEDIEIAYLGTTIKVSHSLFKPHLNKPGRIRYTCHLSSKSVTLEHLQDNKGRFYWSEVNRGRTPLADELGKAIGNFDIQDDESNKEKHFLNHISDINITYKGSQVRVSHSFVDKEVNDTGRIVYTFHFPEKQFTIRQYKENDDFLWKELSGSWSQLAQDLGELLEKYYGVRD